MGSLEVMVTDAWRGRGSLVLKVSDRGRFITSSSSVPLKTHGVGERSSRWCGSYETGCKLRCRPRHLTIAQNHEVHRQKPLGS
ncbi:hypothetical protein TNCV_3299311 [Trichonephila clavipes]|uniref:Uncharacterized protein n=1 Tax=Trichonephila clavipes TaxID=2585209 RepID=A0A8X7B7B0_TRICX|nr:hypothetical protein TNCV_3299311 [Trichonephila clavipes]